MDTVDILYVIGTGSMNKNAEIKYSLRTLEAHCKGVGRVVISGDIPNFIGRKATLVPCHDTSVYGKHWNMLHKIKEGIVKGKLDRPFLFSCDDHFFTADTDLRKWPQRLRAEHIYTQEEWESENGRPCGKYQRSVAATGKVLRAAGLPDVNTVWHGDMWIDPSYLGDVLELAQRNKHTSIYGLEPMMLFEAFMHRDGKDGTLVPIEKDVKASSFEDAMRYADEQGCFSTSDRAWVDGRLEKWFNHVFPNKSKYEI